MIQLAFENVKNLLEQSEDGVFSAYLMVDPALQENQASHPAWQVWLKSRMNELESGLDTEHKARFMAVRARVDEFLAGYQPDAKSLVLFFGADDDSQNSYELPISLESNRASFGEPAVAPLLWAIDEYERYVVVLVDSEKSIFFTAYLGGATFEERIELNIEDYDWGQKTLMGAAISGSNGEGGYVAGNNKDKFDDMIGEHVARFHREVADRIRKLVEKDGIERIVLGGVEESAQAVKNALHVTARKALVGDVLNIPLRLNANEVMQHVAPVVEMYERNQELELVSQVIDFAKSGGRGALGHADVNMALEMQRVEMLLLPWSNENEATLEQLMSKALRNSSKIELVHGEAAERLNAEGGIGARLYYAFQQQPENAVGGEVIR